MFHRMKRHGGVEGLVVAPTRELAIQIQAECEKFGAEHGFASVVVYGGASAYEQKNNLKTKKPCVVIGTPGRLTDLMSQEGVLSLSQLSVIVLDEADRMLDMGFEPQIKAIFAATPTERQTLLFSATWPKAVRKLAAGYLRDKEHVQEIFIGEGAADGELAANKAISQRFIEARDHEKDEHLYNLICEFPDDSRVVIFANTKRRVENLAKTFSAEGFGTVSVHGDKSQADREASLRKFVANQCPLMMATDVAARGLDIKGVTHVINYDMARDVESYVHRIGRTGRAGEIGAAVTFWNPDYDKACTPALIKIARDAGQDVPAWLAKHEKTKESKQWRVADARM
jgi:superfamily II DNA/RNA helicase